MARCLNVTKRLLAIVWSVSGKCHNRDTFTRAVNNAYICADISRSRPAGKSTNTTIWQGVLDFHCDYRLLPRNESTCDKTYTRNCHTSYDGIMSRHSKTHINPYYAGILHYNALSNGMLLSYVKDMYIFYFAPCRQFSTDSYDPPVSGHQIKSGQQDGVVFRKVSVSDNKMKSPVNKMEESNYDSDDDSIKPALDAITPNVPTPSFVEIIPGKGPPPEPPVDCCMSGCANCVWIQYAEELKRYFTKEEGNIKAKAAIEQIDNPGLQMFLKFELGLL